MRALSSSLCADVTLENSTGREKKNNVRERKKGRERESNILTRGGKQEEKIYLISKLVRDVTYWANATVTKTFSPRFHLLSSLTEAR